VCSNYRGFAGGSAQKLPASLQGRAILNVFTWLAFRFNLWPTMIRFAIRTAMMFSITLLGGIILIVGIITVLDWIARRKDRQTSNRAA
jgi:hypothetical protein